MRGRRNWLVLVIVCTLLWDGGVLADDAASEDSPEDDDIVDGLVERYLDEFRLYNECKGMNLFVEYKAVRSSDIDLTQAEIEAAVESRLRLMHFFDEQQDAFLTLDIGVFGPAFRTLVKYRKPVFDPASGVPSHATTWQYGSRGMHGDDSGYILFVLTRDTDNFLAEYLRVNESACE